MDRINKKGISAIVATVLIILITVAAVTIIWAAIIPMINDQLGRATQCSSAVAQLTLKGAYTCYDNGGTVGLDSDDSVRIQVARGVQDFVLSDIQILLEKDGSSVRFKLVEASLTNKTQLPKAGELKVFTINSANLTSAGALNSTSASIAPIIFVNNDDVICESTGGSVPLKPC